MPGTQMHGCTLQDPPAMQRRGAPGTGPTAWPGRCPHHLAAQRHPEITDVRALSRRLLKKGFASVAQKVFFL